MKKGSIIGTLTLHFLDQDIKYNLIVKEDVKASGFIRKVINYLKDIVSGNLNVLN